MGGLFRQESFLGKMLVGAPGFLGSKADPGGTVLGMYGKHPKTPIDPMAFSGIYGYDVKRQQAAADPNSYNYSTAATLKAQAPGKPKAVLTPEDEKSTSKLLLGE